MRMSHAPLPLLESSSTAHRLRVDSRWPGRSEALLVGEAGRDELRRGAGDRSVHSSFFLAVVLGFVFASMASGVMPLWSTLRTPPSGVLWLAATRPLATAAWCRARPEWPESVPPSNKLEADRALHPASSDLRGGEEDGVEVEILLAFPLWWSSCELWRRRFTPSPARPSALVGACPPPILYLRRQSLVDSGEQLMRRPQREWIPNRLVQANQRPAISVSSSSAAVRR